MSYTYLVVEDDENLQQTLKGMLEGKGYPTHSVGSGEEAQEWLLQNPDTKALVADLRLVGGMTGFALTTWIRSTPALAHMQIVAITANDSYEYQTKAQAAGVDYYVPKPLGQEFARVVEEIARS
jgi:CheY-like chemotaxis protein